MMLRRRTVRGTAPGECRCGLVAEVSRDLSPETYGRLYERCPLFSSTDKNSGCGYFRWVEVDETEWQKDAIEQLLAAKTKSEKSFLEAVSNVSFLLDRFTQAAGENEVLRCKNAQLTEHAEFCKNPGSRDDMHLHLLDNLEHLFIKVLPVTANQISIPFHPLLKQIATLLHFPEPVYHIQDFSKNSAYVSVETNIMQSLTRSLILTYVGGPADTLEESCEIAAKKAVLNLSKKWGILVEDLSFERYGCLERCRRLYGLKRKELGNLIKGKQTGNLEEDVFTIRGYSKRICLDYMPLLRKIFRTIAIQCTPLETVKHCAGCYTSWIMVQPLFNNAAKEIFIGPTCDSLAVAKSYLAKKVIMYLIPAYNLDVVDVNYESRCSETASLLCNLELESCFSIRERLNGVAGDRAFSCLLIEQDELTFENATGHIPIITPAPVKVESTGSGRFPSPKNMIVCQAGPYPVYYKVRPQKGMSSKRGRNA